MSAPVASLAPALPLTVRLADYGDSADGACLIALLDAYARDPMGGGTPLPDSVRAGLVAALAAHPGAFSLLAFDGDEAVALANCQTGFSTFKARALVNVHDFAVLQKARGRGVGKALMTAVEAEARRRGACKITLEVLSGNGPARSLYRAAGFGDYALDPEMGTAQFWEKTL